MERMRECREVRARDVMGPDVRGERMRARNGWARERAGMVVISIPISPSNNLITESNHL